ncbi:MAG: universal stress protein [Desulfosoma sp.]|uniref:universal stress protein n=1 Tax=Desulfosoma sp. TaxID=2603217 RepID=UPI004048F5C5
MFEKILYPTDFSAVSQKALRCLKAMRGAGVKLVVALRVLNDKTMACIAKGIALSGKDVANFLNEVLESLRQEAWEDMRPIESELKAAGLKVTSRVEEGVPHVKILEVANEENVSAIILGSHGRSNLSSVLLGSVSEYVIRHAKKPVIVVRRD